MCWFQLSVLLCSLFPLIGGGSMIFAQSGSAARHDHAQPPAYRISAGDKLNIRFFSNPELNETEMLVRPDGYINPQLINEIRAAGRTVSELKTELERAYNEILLSPLITVSVVDLVPARIFVGGQVTKPGKYELREAQTVVQAVFLAGGFTNDARRTMVIHARPNASGDWDIRVSNVLKIIEGKSLEKDIDLRDGDYVFVPNSRISQMTKAVEAFRGFLPRFL
jgi:polysaccharide biosynthesis/export protein